MHLEGWLSKNYYILFSDSEKELYKEKHHLGKYLPEYEFFGLFNWDNFIVNVPNKYYAIVPIIPLLPKYVTKFSYKNRSILLTQDPSLKGKMRWYKTPLVYGGDPKDEGNIAWIGIEEHAKLIETWNKKYSEQSKA